MGYSVVHETQLLKPESTIYNYAIAISPTYIWCFSAPRVVTFPIKKEPKQLFLSIQLKENTEKQAHLPKTKPIAIIEKVHDPD